MTTLKDAIARLPRWEQEAARRLLLHGRLTDRDEEDVLDLLIGGPVGPVDDLAWLDDSATGRPPGKRLAGVTAGANVGALAAGTTLTVDPAVDICVVDAPNGTGKTTFLRLLRAAAGSGDATDLLPDVLNTTAAPSVASGTFLLSASGAPPEKVEWRSAPHTRLDMDVAVFDRADARTVVDTGHAIELWPGGLDVFAALVDLRKRLKVRLLALATEIEPAEPPAFDEVIGTSVHSAVLDNDLDVLYRLAALTPTDERRLAQLESGTSPGLADAVSRQVGRAADARILRSALDAFERLQGAVDPAVVERADHVRGRIAGGQGNGTTSAPDGIDAYEWIKLTRHADQVLGASRPGGFGAVAAGTPCPLCAHPLSTDTLHALVTAASSSLPSAERTDDWVSELDALNRRAIEAVSAVERALAEFLALSVGHALDPQAIDALAAAARTTATALSAHGLRRTPFDLLVLLRSMRADVEGLLDRVQDLSDEPVTSAADDDSERSELVARRVLRDHFARFQRYAEGMAEQRRLRDLAGTLSTTAISALSKKLASGQGVQAFIHSLTPRLERLGLGDLQVQRVLSTKAGVTTIRLAPPTTQYKGLPLGRILSDGEQTLLAMSVFFADLDARGRPGTAFLDDPLSTLDDENTTRAADLIAQESVRRPLVVLSHDPRDWAVLREAAARLGRTAGRGTVGQAPTIHSQWS